MKNIVVASFVVAIVTIPSPSRPLELHESGGCMTDGCHSKMRESMKGFVIPHPPSDDGACIVCHNDHGDSIPVDKSLRLPVAESCFSCHAEFGKRIRESRFVHTLVKEGRCTHCHEPHGGRYTKLRKKFYPPSEWDPHAWSGDTRMCMECHPPNVHLQEETISGTGFRNGSTNLHSKHVGRNKRRNCTACHAMHASDQEFHIRPEVPFGTGGWTLPVNFTKTSNGGRCIIGCHREMAYDRENPIAYGPMIRK